MYGIGVLCSSRVVRLCSVRQYSKNTKKLLEFLAKMPKANSARITEAQRQRQNIARKSDKYAPSTVYLQVIGSGARGAPNTLYLFTDQKRYLFNCGECTQRLAHEHKVKLSRLDHIFITSKTWRNIGGLPGLSLTLQDVGVPNITLHGPEGLDELYYATRRFVIMKDMNVTMASCTPVEDFEDNALNVKYVILGPNDKILDPDKPPAKRPKTASTHREFEEFVNDDTDYYKSDARRNDRNKDKQNLKTKELDKAEKLKKKTEQVLHTLQKKTHCTVAYICTLKKRLGTLDLAKCVELGVKPGPMLGQLKSGQDVVLRDGTLVLSKDVKTPDDPGPVFIVLEVPDITYLKESEFAEHFDSGTNPAENIPVLIVHYTPPHVMNDPVYRAFMLKFGPSTRHMSMNSDNCCLGSEAVHRTQHKLNLLDTDIFPLLKDHSVPTEWHSRGPEPTSAKRGLEDLKNKDSSYHHIGHISRRIENRWGKMVTTLGLEYSKDYVLPIHRMVMAADFLLDVIAIVQFQNIIRMEGAKKEEESKEGDSAKLLETIVPRTLTMFHLRPNKPVDRSSEPKLHVQDYIQEAMDMDGFAKSLDQFHGLVDKMRRARDDTQREYPKVVFLGTGSCIPSKTRNTSAIALQIDESRSMLMDCGEGTFGQLVRFFGPTKVNAFLRTLKAIYVSHLHADHHIGLMGVLQARREAFEQSKVPAEPVSLLAPGQIFTWLSVYDQQFEKIRNDFELIPNQTLLEVPTQPVGDMTSAILAKIGVQNIRTCLVSHCPNAFGVAINIDGKYKITYSGDTIPCEELVQIGKDTTLLIHEATMEDELVEEARIKMHSTASQAIKIGRDMNAKYTVLTHFSQRYARLPRLNDNILNDNTVGIAFDNMQVSMNDLELLPHMYAPLQLMFAEHCVEMEMKAAHRARAKEREERQLNRPHFEASNVHRWISPGCHGVKYDVNSSVTYRESHASRLRQESKGMAVCGLVSGQRSTLPSKKVKNQSDLDSLRRENVDLVKNQDSVTSVKTLQLNSRSNSQTSHILPDTQKLWKSRPNSPYGHVIDSRSKVLNTVQTTNKPFPQANQYTAETRPPFRTCIGHNSSLSKQLFGKPLAAPVNYKVLIKRECLKRPNTTSPVPKGNEKQSKYQPRHSSSHSEVNKPSLRVTLKQPDTNPLELQAREPVSEVSEHCSGSNAANAAAMRLPSCRTKPFIRPSSTPCTKSTKPVDRKAHESLLSNPPSYTKLPHKTSSDDNMKCSPLRHVTTENLKHQFCRDTPIYCTGRHNACGVKPYKPQLEDIKSSDILLNPSPREQEMKLEVTNESVAPSSTSKKIDERKRVEKLNEVKRKFQSKQFKNNSRYENIEGLNWISWKL